jgi:hypothetical protein
MADGDESYRKQLTQSPGREDFSQLPEADRRLICELKTMMHGVHHKVKRLRSEMEEKLVCHVLSIDLRLLTKRRFES